MAYDEAVVLPILKTRLDRLRTDTSRDEYLKSRIQAADMELARNGIHLLRDSTADAVFLADYTAWRYNNRDAPGSMPEWLRLARRERWLADKRINDAAREGGPMA